MDRTQYVKNANESKDETSEDNLVLHYDSSSEKIKEKLTYCLCQENKNST